MARIIIPDNNDKPKTFDGDNTDEIIIGKNNKGKIVIKGSNKSTIRIGEGNTAEICIEDDNRGTIIVGKGNKGKIKIKDLNEKKGTIIIGDDNEGEICTGDDNEGTITVGKNNKGAINIGDVNEGTITVGADNCGKIKTKDDNEGTIIVGPNNKGDIEIGDVNEGGITLGKGNRGKVKIKDDNEGTVTFGPGNRGDIEVGDVQEGTITGCNRFHCSEFFQEYDKQTLFTTDDQVRNAIIQITQGRAILLSRRAARERTASGTPTPIPTPNTSEKAAIRLLSKLQLDLFKKFFLQPDNSFDTECIQWCFMGFANGEYRNPKTPDEDPSNPRFSRPGEPDGGFFFLFAEFALVAIECNVDKAAWTTLLTSLVKAQEILLQVYPKVRKRDGTSDRSFRGPRVGLGEKERLHDKYKIKNLNELIDCHNKNLKKGLSQPVRLAAFFSPREEMVHLDRVTSHTDELVAIANMLKDDPMISMERAELWTETSKLALRMRKLISLQLDEVIPIGFLGFNEFDNTVALEQGEEDLRGLEYIEQIGSAIRSKLKAIGVSTLSDLAQVDPASTQIKGVSNTRLQRFTSMARIAIAFPSLSSNDVEFVVIGLNIDDPNQFTLEKVRPSTAKLSAARKRVKLPASYKPKAVLELFSKT